MATEEIILRVSPEAARAFRQATSEEQLRLEALVSLQLLGKLQSHRPLDEIINDLSRQAQENGLTLEPHEAEPRTPAEPDKASDNHARSESLPFIGILTEPGIRPPADWKERHDEIIAEEAMDPHADEE